MKQSSHLIYSFSHFCLQNWLKGTIEEGGHFSSLPSLSLEHINTRLLDALGELANLVGAQQRLLRIHGKAVDDQVLRRLAGHIVAAGGRQVTSSTEVGLIDAAHLLRELVAVQLEQLLIEALQLVEAASPHLLVLLQLALVLASQGVQVSARVELGMFLKWWSEKKGMLLLTKFGWTFFFYRNVLRINGGRHRVGVVVEEGVRGEVLIGWLSTRTRSLNCWGHRCRSCRCVGCVSFTWRRLLCRLVLLLWKFVQKRFGDLENRWKYKKQSWKFVVFKNTVRYICLLAAV